MSRHWQGFLRVLLPLAAAGALVALAFPHLASAYHLEAGGRALDRPPIALEHLRKALWWSPDNAEAYRLLGKAYRAQGNWPAAAEALARYTQAQPKNPLGHIELAEIYEELQAAGLPGLEGLDPGVRAVEEWRRAGLNAGNLVEWGRQAHDAKQVAQAETWYKRASHLDPGLGDPWYFLGLLYEEQQQWAQALDAYNRAIASHHLNQVGRSNPYFRAGLIYRWHLDPPQVEEALAAYQSAVHLDDFSNTQDAAQGHYLLGYALREQKADPQTVLFELRRAVELNPGHTWAHLILGLALYDANGDLAGAEAEILQAIKLGLQSPWAYYYLAELYRQEGRTDEARAMYEQALRVAPDFDAAQERLQALQGGE